MPGPRPVAPLAAIRAAAAEAVRAGSLRSVARKIGLSPTGLSNFLEGGRAPYSATIRKLNAWYVQYQLDRQVFSVDTARAGLAVLLEAVPELHLDTMAGRLLECLHDAHQELQVTEPAWLEELRGDE